jgi:hypothetical protein
MRQDYFDALAQMQHHTDIASRHKAINDWVSCFCGAVVDACEDMERIAREMSDIRVAWEKTLGNVRAGSAVELIIDELPATPIFSVETMVRSTGRSKQAINLATNRLLEVGIIRQTSQGKRSRVFEAPSVLEEFSMVERRLASPSRDTNIDPPARRVPDRPAAGSTNRTT